LEDGLLFTGEWEVRANAYPVTSDPNPNGPREMLRYYGDVGGENCVVQERCPYCFADLGDGEAGPSYFDLEAACEATT